MISFKLHVDYQGLLDCHSSKSRKPKALREKSSSIRILVAFHLSHGYFLFPGHVLSWSSTLRRLCFKMPAKLVLNGDQIVLVYLTVKLTKMYITSCGIFRRILSRLYCRCLGLFNLWKSLTISGLKCVVQLQLQLWIPRFRINNSLKMQSSSFSL